MITIKKEIKLFFKSFYISSLILFCIIFSFYGMAKAYKNIRRIGFGEYRNAVEYKDGTIFFFDYKIELSD